jgi:homoserine dehydrogenase
MTVVEARTSAAPIAAPARASEIRIGLLGVGRVGAAVAKRAPSASKIGGRRMRIVSALARDASRTRDGVTGLTDKPEGVFASRPTVIVEALGGIEPARTLVLEALARGIPVVTANKTLLAYHGEELMAAACAAGVALRFEASVIAGVPFLGTLARRPFAADITSLVGIVNGTTNYVLSRMSTAHTSYADALAEAQRCGYAEPDPAKDVNGFDAAEKLAVLIRQCAGMRVIAPAIETTGISRITPEDHEHAAELGGTIKPIVFAAWDQPQISAFAGPAFVPRTHALSAIDGPTNAICLCDRNGREVSFAGPGAGPDVTASTILDDVLEASAERPLDYEPAPAASVAAPSTRWFVRLASRDRLPPGTEVAAICARQNVWIDQTSLADTRRGCETKWLLTHACRRDQIERVAAALQAASCAATAWRAVQDRHAMV